MLRTSSVLGFLLVIILVISCEPVPRNQLTTEAKVADMYWLYSQFENNYAPLHYKEALYGFNFAQLKATYLEAAKATKTNEDFFLLQHKFVATFRDAHTGGSLTAASLPNRGKVAYLGFTGMRNGDSLYVKELLPTTDNSASKFPIQVGDRIIKLDGKDLKEVIDNELVSYRNLGNAESNYTMLMNKIFNRVSLNLPMPRNETAVVTLIRMVNESDVELTYTLPWIIKDLYLFQTEQDRAKEKKADLDYVRIDRGNHDPLTLALTDFNGKVVSISDLMEKLDRSSEDYDFRKNFIFVDNISQWTAASLDSYEIKTPLERLQDARALPKDYVFIPTSSIYPSYVTSVTSGDTTKLVGYIYLDTFGPSGSAESVIDEFTGTLKQMQTLGVQGIVIDLINNGGGSLSLGMQLAQALSNKKIEAPEIQFVLSDSWFDEFEKESINGNSDAEKELGHRALVRLEGDRTAGLNLSSKFNIETLMPFQLVPNIAIKKNPKIVLMVNEMCASMCDIFSAVLQDNGMATIIGTKTMGAGGNVVNHYFAPNGHFMVRQTESLILRKDGSYIENVGVKPDVDVPVVNSASTKYEDVQTKAFELLLK